MILLQHKGYKSHVLAAENQRAATPTQQQPDICLFHLILTGKYD